MTHLETRMFPAFQRKLMRRKDKPSGTSLQVLLC
jgi:hypothetical protein